MTDPASDFELLEAWGDGDLNAGQALYRRHARSLYRFLRTKIGDGLEDLMQQTWLACVEGRARFRRESKFRTYLLQVARFQLHEYYRRRNRQPSLDFSVTSAMNLDPSPSQWLAKRQDELLLLQALRSVPVEQQLVLELRFWEDLTGGEIAEVLGVPEGTIRSWLRRATQALKAELTRLSIDQAPIRETLDDLDAWARRLHDALASDPEN